MSISFKRKFGCLAFVGLLASVISFPSSSSTYAKSDTRELLFASKTNLEELDEFVTSNKNSMSALNNRKIKLVATYPKDTNDFSDYDSIAYNYKDVKKDKKLQKALQSALADGKKVYLYGGLTLEEYCELLNIDRLNAQMELDDTKETVNVSFYDIEGDEKKEKKQKDDMERKPDYNKHEIIGYTLDKNAPYKLFISDINRYDEKGKTIPSDEIFLQEILEHENKDIDKSEFTTSSNRVVKSAYDITASAWYLTKKAGSINSHWKLYKNNDEDDDKYDYFFVKDTSSIQTYEWSWDAEEFRVRHELVFSSDELDDAEPNDRSKNPYTISLGYPFSVSYSYQLETEPKIDLTLNKEKDYSEWVVTGSELESDKDDYEFVTAWASTGTYAAIDIEHTVYFFAGIDVETDADQSISIRYDY